MIDRMTPSARFGAGLSQAADAGDGRPRGVRAPVRDALGRGAAADAGRSIFASPDLCEDAEAPAGGDRRRRVGARAPHRLDGRGHRRRRPGGRGGARARRVGAPTCPAPRLHPVPARRAAGRRGDGRARVARRASPTRPRATSGPIMMLADPFTFPADGLLAQLNEEPGAPVVVGGLASGGRRPGDHRLFAGADVLDRGRGRRGPARGRASAPWCRRAACRSGPEMVITAAEGSTVHELAGMPALAEARGGGRRPRPGRARAGGRGPPGRARDRREHPRLRARRLPHPLRSTAATATPAPWCVGERVRVGQTMRFHVRDAGSADEDLRAALRGGPGELGDADAGRRAGVQLQRARHAHVPGARPRRRGHRRGARPHPRRRACSATVRSGRSAGKSFLHGFTATMALFERAPRAHEMPVNSTSHHKVSRDGVHVSHRFHIQSLRGVIHIQGRAEDE